MRDSESTDLRRDEPAASIPETYDRYLGPILFEPYAVELEKRIAGELDQGVPSGLAPRILEIACGTGALTKRILGYLHTSAEAQSPAPPPELVATTLHESMLDYARVKIDRDRQLEWRQADAAALSFPSSSFDIVVCQFGMMFVPDKEAAMREVRRVLHRGGLFLFTVWDSFDRNPFARIAHEAVASFFPGDPPAFCEIAFGYHRPEEIRASLERSDFFDVAIENVTLTAESPSAADFAKGIVGGTPLVAAIEGRGGATMEAVRAAVAAAEAKLGGDEPFRARMEALLVSARAGGIPTA